MTNRKRIAWGAGPLFELFLAHTPDHDLAYCVDSSSNLKGTKVKGVPIVSPEKLDEENRDEIFVIITATSSGAIQAIHAALSEYGFVFGRNYADLAWVLKDSFRRKVEVALEYTLSADHFVYAHSFNLNSRTSLETTVLGNWLLMEALVATAYLGGSVAEVGAFQGGNAYLQLSAMALRQDRRPYYVLDSFQGFPPLSVCDPVGMQAAYSADDYMPNQIANALRQFEQSVVIPGFVPETFAQIPAGERFSLVFYDCDLYQPALDTYAFFWDRLETGGLLVIHDNVATPHGWTGVRKATEAFFGPRSIPVLDFWETTMSVVRKPST